MSSRLQCVVDSSVWNDLHWGGCLTQALALGAEFHVPDLIAAELEHPRCPFRLPPGTVLEHPTELAPVVSLRERCAGLSVQDAASLLLARELGIPLLGSDGPLRSAATQRGVEVIGTLWLLDRMVEVGLLRPRAAATALRRMIDSGRRLPAAATESRLRSWDVEA